MKDIIHFIVSMSVISACLSVENINELFEKVNKNAVEYNAIAADIAWESSVNPGNPELPRIAARYQRQRIIWQQSICSKLAELRDYHLLNSTQRRQTYLLCRGPIYTFNEARKMSANYEELQSTYSDAEICLPIDRSISKTNLADVENAILNYKSNIERYFEMEANMSVAFAAKSAVTEQKSANELCLKGDSDFEKVISFSRDEQVLRWLWLVWREKVGPTIREPYEKLIRIENRAAMRNGYRDIGESWRDELEISNLRVLCHELFESVKPLYELLHGVVRYFLRRQYGDVVSERGPIPAHLLGSLWGDNWESLIDLIAPVKINLNESIKKLNWTVLHMVKRAEDFYQSLGLPPLTETFWRKSIFVQDKHNQARCHGTAADMFKTDDFRLLYCSETSIKDLYVLHHELGHIQYFMAYEKQPGIFRQANTAFHESVGDAVMYGVMAPQHLNRLGLINDSTLIQLNTEHNILVDNSLIEDDKHKFEDNGREHENDNYNKYNKKDTENSNDVIEELFSPGNILLLSQALNKIPKIPFALLIEEYRWKYFEDIADTMKYAEVFMKNSTQKHRNKDFWDMALKLQGIIPPDSRGEEYFDVGAIFHVSDNTPYIRYFLGSFLQHQFYESFCKTAVFGRRDFKGPLPNTISMDKCDIYGSKSVGKLMKDIMSRGDSENWREILQQTTGKDFISASALKRYYSRLYGILERLVRAYNIPIGW